MFIGFISKTGFRLPDHAEQNYTPAKSAEILADHFSSISQEFSPLSIDNLPLNIQNYLSDYNKDQAPILSENDVYRRIIKAKKPNGLIPGDLPPKLVKAFPELLAGPVTEIYNSITRTASYPEQWKVEHQIALPKVYPPQSEDELRNISKTQFFSKVYESFVGGWLLPIIQPYLDPGQCGIKGFSVTHYLIKLLHFI